MNYYWYNIVVFLTKSFIKKALTENNEIGFDNFHIESSFIEKQFQYPLSKYWKWFLAEVCNENGEEWMVPDPFVPKSPFILSFILQECQLFPDQVWVDSTYRNILFWKHLFYFMKLSKLKGKVGPLLIRINPSLYRVNESYVSLDIRFAQS